MADGAQSSLPPGQATTPPGNESAPSVAVSGSVTSKTTKELEERAENEGEIETPRRTPKPQAFWTDAAARLSRRIDDLEAVILKSEWTKPVIITLVFGLVSVICSVIGLWMYFQDRKRQQGNG